MVVWSHVKKPHRLCDWGVTLALLQQNTHSHVQVIQITKMLLFLLGLIEYFSQHLGEYEHVLAALEDLNLSILKAMDKTKKVSPVSSILWSCSGENMKMLFLAGSFASALVTQAGFAGAGPTPQTWCSTILRLQVEAAANESPIKWMKSQLEEMSGAH